VGRVVDLYIPRDKETNRHKGYAFAEYESEEIADYAISGQDKCSQNTRTPMTPKPNSPPIPKPTSVHTREIGASREYSQSLVYNRISSTLVLVTSATSNGNYEYKKACIWLYNVRPTGVGVGDTFNCVSVPLH
ncbi:hypothetical protein BHM03_00041384, partial [Ensete ventricosum]